MLHRLVVIILLSLSRFEFSQAQQNEFFSPERAKQHLVLPPTQVMVVGVWHLDAASPNFRLDWLEPILCRLRAYKPDVILTEALSGEQVMGLDAYAAYHGDAGNYAGPTLEMAKATQAQMQLSAA